jgi:hypothetical protein
MRVEAYNVPAAGIDTVDITIDETYEVEGIGRDRVRLQRTLVADRGAPLLGHGAKSVEWETSTVVARFTSLDVSGESEVFGPVRVMLDPSLPAFGVVAAGKCSAALGIVVSMPKHDLVLRSAEAVQLQSQVTTVPPIGDEKTESVAAVRLIDETSKRAIGSLEHARVVWRDLLTQLKR